MEEMMPGEVTSTRIAAITRATRGADHMVAMREGGSGGRTEVTGTLVHALMFLPDGELLGVVPEDKEQGFAWRMKLVLLHLLLRRVLRQQQLRE
jgi:hypothetical protein